MKKQIALLATLIAASGFTAFGQDWLAINNVGTSVWDLTGSNGGTVAGQGAWGAIGDYDVVWLWASASASDSLSAVGPSQYASNKFGAASQQVSTNGVSSVSSALSTTTLSSMLSGGWSVVNDEASGAGSAATGEAIVGLGTKGGVLAFNGSDAFQVNGILVGSGSNIKMLAIAVNASAIVSGNLVVADITDIGWSNPFLESVGTSSTDPNANATEGGAMNAFGVVAVPEPTTLALAGLGGLSMLFLRRRKA